MMLYGVAFCSIREWLSPPRTRGFVIRVSLCIVALRARLNSAQGFNASDMDPRDSKIYASRWLPLVPGSY